jgi:hypothetical protein
MCVVFAITIYTVAMFKYGMHKENAKEKTHGNHPKVFPSNIYYYNVVHPVCLLFQLPYAPLLTTNTSVVVIVTIIIQYSV